MNAQSQYRREAAKRQIMGAWMAESSKASNHTTTNMNVDSDVDGSNPDHVRLLMEDLQEKFDQHLELLKADLFSAKNQQQEELSMGLLKLPKSIRQMTIREFNQMHSCNLLSLLKRNDGVMPSSFKKRNFSGTAVVAETPAPTRSRNPVAPGSAIRTARRGEAILYVLLPLWIV